MHRRSMHKGKLIDELFAAVEKAEREVGHRPPAKDVSRDRDSRPSPRETESGADQCSANQCSKIDAGGRARKQAQARDQEGQGGI
jgi:hypothetical protein